MIVARLLTRITVLDEEPAQSVGVLRRLFIARGPDSVCRDIVLQWLAGRSH